MNDNIPLEEGLFLLAAWHYLNTFGYSYSDKPDECHPPHLLDTSQVRPLAKICSIKTNDISAGNIERYIKATIIASVNRSVHLVVALEFMLLFTSSQAQVSKGVQGAIFAHIAPGGAESLSQIERFKILPMSPSHSWVSL